MDKNLNRTILTDAIETAGLGYWAEVKNIKRDKAGWVLSFDIRDNDDEGPRISENWHRINFNNVMKARTKILNGDIDIRRDIAQQFVGKEWNYDSEGTDCIIQIIVFGELVYG